MVIFMYNNNALNNFVLNVLKKNNTITITEEEILRNSISRLDALIPTTLKVILKKLSEKTGTTMKEHLVRALMLYLENFDISSIDMDVITIRRSEYEELKRINKELKNKIQKFMGLNEKMDKIIKENEKLKRKNKELKKENKKLNAKTITLQNKMNRELKKDIGARLLNEIESGRIKGYKDIIRVLELHHFDDIIKFNNKMFVKGFEVIDKDNHDYKIWRFKDSRLKNYVLFGECREESIIIRNDNEIIKNMVNNMKLEKQKQKELKNKIYNARIKINNELHELADKFPEYKFEILKHCITNINDFEELTHKVNEINEWLNQLGFQIRINIDI